MIEGKKEDVDAVTDLTSLADVTEKHKKRNTGFLQKHFVSFLLHIPCIRKHFWKNWQMTIQQPG